MTFLKLMQTKRAKTIASSAEESAAWRTKTLQIKNQISLAVKNDDSEIGLLKMVNDLSDTSADGQSAVMQSDAKEDARTSL
jgi:hypothetical protein